jgi:hypothetical protein
MSKPKTPLVMFAYHRPMHADRALDSLARCRRLDRCAVHIYCDGPEDPQAMARVAEARDVVREWAGRLPASVVERKEHMGLARSIVSGVTELCERHGRVIVLEDDHVVSADFVDYMLEALDRYEDEESVHQISGFMFPVDHPPRPDAFFLPLTTTWGWATWWRAWRKFDFHAEDAEARLADPATRRRFDFYDSYPFARLLADRIAGRNDSWGILWWWTVFKQDGLALHPRRPLVFNDGFDGTGRHCGRKGGDDPSVRDATLRFRFDRPFVFPTAVAPDEEAVQRIARSGVMKRYA